MAERIQTMTFEDDGKIPNNAALPLILYRNVLPEASDRATACRSLFEAHGWGGAWVNGVFAYHHYHSTAHEVMGVTGGRARLRFGGEYGETVRVDTGDVVVIPAGVGHCRVEASPDFQVVGAYPDGQNWDLRTTDPDERAQAIENIRQVPLPHQDPVMGEEGPLITHWHDAS
ncbi:MAG: cupin domain-containing protein [Chloroflexota bacterium]